MRRGLVFFTILFYCIPVQAQELDAKKMRYIEQFKYWAMDEQIRTGVPAAISLAQGILETGSGTSDLCVQANNHFGIKCKKEWTGETFLHDDDRRHECFRKYKSAKDSYVDHSNFLKDRAHYKFLFDLESSDYKGWCNGLRKAGYATNPKYAIRLIQLIEKYNLQEYTYEAVELTKDQEMVAEVVPSEDVPEIKKKEVVEVVNVAPKSTAMKPKIKHVYDKLITKNSRNGFWARKGDYLLPEAVQYNIRYAKLLAINDLEDKPLYADMFIYLKRKSKKGPRMFHRVKEGETLHSISQDAGVQLRSLYVYNNLYDGEEPAVGEKVYLQARSSKTPKLRGAVAVKLVVKKVVQEVEKETAPVKTKKIVVAKSEVAEKKDLIREVEKIPVKKPDVVVESKKNLETELEKRTIPIKSKVEKTKTEPQVTKNVVVAKKNIAMKTEVDKAKVTPVLATKGAESPIIDLDKAKKVERLMGDGSKEIERLHYENQRALQQRKVIAEPQSNNEKIIIDKATKTKTKRTSSKRDYNQKNVSDDVKDLKKKFDNLIYEEE